MGAFRLALPAELTAAGIARERVRAHLTSVPEDQLDPVILATSELVANAVLHGEGAVEVDVDPGPNVVHVEVTDRGTATPRIQRIHGVEEDSGRGLHMVELLASRWGVTAAKPGPGKTVWFDVDRNVRPAAGGAWTPG